MGIWVAHIVTSIVCPFAIIVPISTSNHKWRGRSHASCLYLSFEGRLIWDDALAAEDCFGSCFNAGLGIGVACSRPQSFLGSLFLFS